jgi:putative permease
MARTPTRARKSAASPVELGETGPTDIADPLTKLEVKKAAVWIGIAALVVLTVFLAQPLLVIFGGMVFAATIDGGARLLGRVLPIGRGWRVGIVLLLSVLFAVWTAWFAGSQIAAEAAAFPATVETQVLRAIAWPKNFEAILQQLLGGVGQLTRAVGGVLGGFATGFLVMVMGIYFALEPDLYRRGFAWLLPTKEREHFEGTAVAMGKTLRRLMAGRLLAMFVEGIATWALLAAYGVPMAGLLGLLTGLLAFLPNIGAPISGALMVLVGFSGGTDMGIYCLIVYLVVQTVDGNIIVPLVAKHTADLAPALVLGAQLIMGALFGILGLALADPLVAMLKVALERQSLRNESA